MKHDRDSRRQDEWSGSSTHESGSRAGEPPPAVGVYDRPDARPGGLSATRWWGVVLLIALVAVGAFLLLQFVL